MAWLRFADGIWPWQSYTRFTHQLREFPLPQRGDLPDDLPEVAILTPCKDAERYLDMFFRLVDSLDYPKHKLHLMMLEGDSTDATYAKAEAMLAERNSVYASTKLLKFDTGNDYGEGHRSRVDIQRRRRAAIAACRNRLLDAAMQTDAGFHLFIDIDLVEIPPETLKEALRFNAPILMANCFIEGTQAVFDLNAFRYTRPVSDRSAKRFVKGGIYQPPKGFFRHYPDFRDGNEIEPLHSVGDTFLLIRRDVVAAGVDFPEDPFQLHIETEGLSLKASDLGFGSFSAPQLFVVHGRGG